MGIHELINNGKTNEETVKVEELQTHPKIKTSKKRTPELSDDHKMSPLDSMTLMPEIELDNQTHEIKDGAGIAPKGREEGGRKI